MIFIVMQIRNCVKAFLIKAKRVKAQFKEIFKKIKKIYDLSTFSDVISQVKKYSMNFI